METRIPTHLWLEGELRRIQSLGIPVYVNHRGDHSTGTVIQKISNMAGECKVVGQQRDLLGALVWINLLQDEIVPESEADAYIQRSLQRDPDVWVIEIEDKSMTAMLSFS